MGLVVTVISCKKGGGCTDPGALNYGPQAEYDDGSCLYSTNSPSWGISFHGDLTTSYAENWDDWDFKLNGISGWVTTSYAENWDDWDFNLGGLTGSIQTSYAENWDNWDLITSNYHISIQTSFSEDWDNWDIDDDNSNWHADVKTSFSEDWDNWDALGDSLDLDIETSYSENWDDWNVSGKTGEDVPLEFQLAATFVPVIVNVLRIQSIIP